MADYIPEDVLINVLMRLPVEAIVRFTLVCKSWFSLITSPNFISHYLNQTIPYNNSNNGHLLVQYCTVQEHYSLQFDGNNTFHEYKKFDFPLTCLSPHFSIVGSCNGLICISDDQLCYNLGMYLWNPCIRKVVAISNPNITFASHFMHSLGFDSVTNDFKVVRIVQFKWDYDPEVEIYSLKSGCWKGISFGKAMPYIIEEPSKQAYVNGVAHWIAYARRGENYSMVSFDMSDEVFKVMSVLNLIAHWDFEKEMHLFPFRESISLIEHWFVWGRDSHCPIWVMKEYGVAESRSKLCRIDLSEHMMKPLSLRSNGEVILTTIRWSLVFYDPKSTQITDLEIYGRRDTCWNSFYWHSFYVGTHKESLVLLDKGVDFCDTVISNHFGIKGRQYWTEWS